MHIREMNRAGRSAPAVADGPCPRPVSPGNAARGQSGRWSRPSLPHEAERPDVPSPSLASLLSPDVQTGRQRAADPRLTHPLEGNPGAPLARPRAFVGHVSPVAALHAIRPA